MAAATQQVSTPVLSDEKKAIFEELLKAARDKVALAPKVGAKEEVVSYGYISNRHKDNHDQHNLSGNPVPSYPQFIPLQKYPIEFKHHGPLPQGSKGGVVYVDGAYSTARKWLIAFDYSNKKVYAEAGPIEDVDWNVIEVKLDASGDSSFHEDPALGGKAHAAINDDAHIVVAWFIN
ncbi:jasmonate-induced protein homolog [Chenopodium quinoa]|uniref:jasmonate-induced protein homolog n=1 Tax=Chenopodium quinoa TaxID=63459 RepID=UPI000B785F0E|nr:jasmonate-induced protein homolog [Chenopodium quinoa]